MLEPTQPTPVPAQQQHPILALVVAWLFVFTAVLAALWVWF